MENLELFVRIEFDGSICIAELAEGEAILAENDEVYDSRYVLMTREEFENLPDFQGF